jgi:hypothetical protein
MSTRGPRKCPPMDTDDVHARGHLKMRTQMYIIWDVHAWTFSRPTRGHCFPAGHGINRSWRHKGIQVSTLSYSVYNYVIRATQRLWNISSHFFSFFLNLSLCKSTQGGYNGKFPTLAELACEGMWWAVRNLIRRHVPNDAEYTEVFHGKTAAQWASHHGVPHLSREITYYVSPRQDLDSRCVMVKSLCHLCGILVLWNTLGSRHELVPYLTVNYCCRT